MTVTATVTRRKEKPATERATIPQLREVSTAYADLECARDLITLELEDIRVSRIALAAALRSHTTVAEMTVQWRGPLGMGTPERRVVRLPVARPQAEPKPVLTEQMRAFREKVRGVLLPSLVDQLMPPDPPPAPPPGEDGLKVLAEREAVLHAGLVIVSKELEAERLRASAIVRDQVRDQFQGLKQQLVDATVALFKAQNAYLGMVTELRNGAIASAALGHLEVAHLPGGTSYDLWFRHVRKEGLLREPPAGAIR
jgi:hypothetical protein